MIHDVLIIGGGPGGYRAAERAGHHKMSVVLFEERALGGVCLNEGCMPTKTLLYSAKLYDYAKGGAAKYGIRSSAELDHAAVIARKDRIVKTLTSEVKVVNASAKISGKSASGFLVTASNGENYEGRNLILASGSSAAVPPIPGLKESLEKGIAVTNREILALKELPGKLIVLGGGVIGLEMASYFQSAGSEVTVVEMLNKIGGPVDGEMSRAVQEVYGKRGLKILISTKASRMRR